MKDTGRSYLIGVRVSALEKEAIRRQAEDKDTSQSEIAHSMLRRAGLSELVELYFGDDAECKPHISGIVAEETHRA